MKEQAQTTPNQNKATLTAAIEYKLGRMNNQGVSWGRLSTMRPHKLVTLHGESVTLFAVVSYSLYDDTDWDIIATFRDRQKAEKLLRMLAEQAQENELVEVVDHYTDEDGITHGRPLFVKP